MKIRFKKMHGAGNDFILFRESDVLPEDFSALARSVCDRHFGIGADGMMIAAESDKEDVKMLFYNADGSIAEMCGNGIRCFSRFVYEEGIVEATEFVVETLAGPQTVLLNLVNDKVDSVQIGMGKALSLPAQIPVKTDKAVFTDETVQILSRQVKLSSLRVGVPHTMVLDTNFNENTVLELGPEIEKHHIFPEKTNVNFVDVIDRQTMRVATWERGAGATLACGTGACAAFFDAFRKGLVDSHVKVHVPGGILKISVNAFDEIIMVGNAIFVAEGHYYYDDGGCL